MSSDRVSERNKLALEGPGDDVHDFPTTPPTVGSYRAHSSGFGPWWFATPSEAGAGGRFDVATPKGTCYVANDIETAVRERLGIVAARKRPLVDGDLLRDTVVSQLEPCDRPENDGFLADMLDKDASRWITREIFGDLPYKLTQKWAEKFASAKFAGIRYEPRFTMGSSYAEAWFGPQGAHTKPYKAVNDWRDDVEIRSEKLDSKIVEIIK